MCVRFGFDLCPIGVLFELFLMVCWLYLGFGYYVGAMLGLCWVLFGFRLVRCWFSFVFMLGSLWVLFGFCLDYFLALFGFYFGFSACSMLGPRLVLFWGSMRVLG